MLGLRGSSMRLVPRKKNKKKYDKVFIYMYDGDIFEYDLREWVIHRDQDWVEVIKNDETEMHSYTVANIVRVRFIRMIENKNISIVKDHSIKPVPPTAA